MKITKKIIISSLTISMILAILVVYYVFFRVERLLDSWQSFLFYRAKVDILSQIQGTEALTLSFVVPIKKIFYGDEKIQGYTVSLTNQNKNGRLEIIKNRAIIHEQNILLDKWGLSLFDLPNFGKGFYILNLIINKELTASNNFFVSDRSSTHLSTVILNTYSFDNLLTVWGLVHYKGIPFQGKLKAEILSRYVGFEGYLKAVSDIDDLEIVKTIDLEVDNGNFTLKSWLPDWSHTSPYFLRIWFEDKEKCISPLFLPRSVTPGLYKSGEMELSRMGKRYVASYRSIPTEKSFYGFSIKRGGEETFDSPWGFEYTASPWELEYPLGEKIRINALKPLRIAAVFIFNPVTLELRTFTSEKPKSLKIIPDDPYSLIYIYSNSKSLEYYDKAILFKDKEIKANISLQGKFKAGEELPIEIKTQRPSKCILIISDARIGREGLNDLLGSEIFSHIREDRDAFSVSRKLTSLKRITEPSIFSSLPPPPPSFLRRYLPLKEKNIQPLPESFKTQKALDIVLFDSFEAKGRVKKMVKMPDKPGIWKAELIVFYGNQYSLDRIEKIFKTY